VAVSEVRRQLGRFGVYIPSGVLASTPVAILRKELARIERLGYGSVWTGETPPSVPVPSREAFALNGLMLAATEQLIVGAGIANISVRTPGAMHTGAATLAEAYPGRFLLGLGGQSGERPLTHLSDYLDAMDEAARHVSPLPGSDYHRVLAALGPRGHRLARKRTDGVHPFLQPVAHTAAARAASGPDPLVIPHQAITLDANAEAARSLLRTVFDLGAGAPDSPYVTNYRRLGYSETEIAERSDRLMDDLLAWGDETAVIARLHAHLDAGADHVLIHPFASGLSHAVDQLERLAPLR
jgi:probable F420-dependent oxidoreductase